MKGGGFHLVGDSSTGKTIATIAGASFGGTGEKFLRTWLATGNGLEGIANERNDTILALDEIGEADAREVGAVVYALANGTGKTRATRSGSAKSPITWGCTPCITCPAWKGFCSVGTRKELGVDPVEAVFTSLWEPLLCLIFSRLTLGNSTDRI